MAAVRKAITDSHPPSIPRLTGALGAVQAASLAITDQRLENPARRELRDLQGAAAHLAVSCQALAGIDGLELLMADTAVPGETVQATVRLAGHPGPGRHIKLALHAEGGLKITPQAITGTEGTFQVAIPAEAKAGARHPLRAEAQVALSENSVLPLSAVRTITLVAPFAAETSLAGVETADGAQMVSLRLTNNLARAQAFSVAVNTPAGWTWRDRQASVNVAARSAASVPLTLVPDDRAKAGRQKIGISVRCGDQEETFRMEMTHVPGAANRLKNAGFEQGSDAALVQWSPWQGGYTADARVKRSGSQSVRLRTDNAGAAVGATQGIGLNQTRVAPLIVRGWCKAESLTGGGDGGCLYVDVYYTDGTKLYGQKVLFAPGTHDWQFGETRIPTTKPVRSISVYAMLRGSTGTAWFDDLFLAEELAPQPPPGSR